MKKVRKAASTSPDLGESSSSGTVNGVDSFREGARRGSNGPPPPPPHRRGMRLVTAFSLSVIAAVLVLSFLGNPSFSREHSDERSDASLDFSRHREAAADSVRQFIMNNVKSDSQIPPLAAGDDGQRSHSLGWQAKLKSAGQNQRSDRMPIGEDKGSSAAVSFDADGGLEQTAPARTVPPTTVPARSYVPMKTRDLNRMLCPTAEEEAELKTIDLSPYRAALQRSLNRYRSVPVNMELRKLVLGEKAGRWPRGQPTGAAVRFLLPSTSIDEVVLRSVISATVAGAPVELLGAGWNRFRLPRRYELLLSYIRRSRLMGHDVVVMVDSDTIFTGEDLMPAISAFVALSPVSEEELATCARDIRFGVRPAPIRFSAENNCMRRDVVDFSNCSSDYDIVEERVAEWAAAHNETYFPSNSSSSPIQRYLNSGFMIARVWALQKYLPAFRDAMRLHKPIYGRLWYDDQSVHSTLYLQLRWWEAVSGALSLTTPRYVTEKECNTSGLSWKPVMYYRKGPFRLPAGLIDLDYGGRWAAMVTRYTMASGLFHVLGGPIYKSANIPRRFSRDRRTPEYHLDELGNPKTARYFTPAGAVRLPYHIHYTAQQFEDCEGSATVLHRCQSPARMKAALGLSEDEPRRPLFLHFAGPLKDFYYPFFWFTVSWLTPLELNTDARTLLQRILFAAPPIVGVTVHPRSGINRRPAVNRKAAFVYYNFSQMCLLAKAAEEG